MQKKYKFLLKICNFIRYSSYIKINCINLILVTSVASCKYVYDTNRHNCIFVYWCLCRSFKSTKHDVNINASLDVKIFT